MDEAVDYDGKTLDSVRQNGYANQVGHGCSSVRCVLMCVQCVSWFEGFVW